MSSPFRCIDDDEAARGETTFLREAGDVRRQLMACRKTCRLNNTSVAASTVCEGLLFPEESVVARRSHGTANAAYSFTHSGESNGGAAVVVVVVELSIKRRNVFTAK